MRLINADTLMEAMYHRAFETDGDTMWQSGCWVRYKAIEQTIKAQPTVNQWIPITDKLPGLDKCVLATTSWGTITIAERWKDTKGEENWFVSEGECNAERDDIVAWKPLPEPYKGETDG